MRPFKLELISQSSRPPGIGARGRRPPPVPPARERRATPRPSPCSLLAPARHAYSALGGWSSCSSLTTLSPRRHHPPDVRRAEKRARDVRAPPPHPALSPHPATARRAACSPPARVRRSPRLPPTNCAAAASPAAARRHARELRQSSAVVALQEASVRGLLPGRPI